MGIPLRKLWQNRPKQYGPWKVVRRNLLYNLKSVGLDTSKIKSALAMWGPGEQLDYLGGMGYVPNNSVGFANNSLIFNGSSSYLSPRPTYLNSVSIVINLGQVTGTSYFLGGIGAEGVRYNGTTFLVYTGDSVNTVTWAKEYRDIVFTAVRQVDLRSYDLYVDGNFIGTSDTGNTGSITIRDIGRRTVSGYHFLGSMSQFIMSDERWSPAQVKALSEIQAFQPVPQKTIFLPQEGGGLTLNLSDTITLSDAIINSIRLNKSDTISISDTFSKALNLNKSDIISLSDEISKSINIFKSDTITLSDQINTLIALTLSLSDTITMSDSISKQPGIVKSDTITMEDAFSKVSEFVRTFSDQIDMSDQISKEIGITKADIITLSDTFSTSEEVIYALVNFLAKDRVFNFTAKNKTFNFTAKNKNFNFGADPRGKKP